MIYIRLTVESYIVSWTFQYVDFEHLTSSYVIRQHRHQLLLAHSHAEATWWDSEGHFWLWKMHNRTDGSSMVILILQTLSNTIITDKLNKCTNFSKLSNNFVELLYCSRMTLALKGSHSLMAMEWGKNFIAQLVKFPTNVSWNIFGKISNRF